MALNLNAERILEVIDELGVDYKERPKTIYATCPVCGQMDKFSIRKSDGKSVCYRGSCSFGSGRSFLQYVMQTASVDKEEAERILHGTPKPFVPGTNLKLSLGKTETKSNDQMPLLPCNYPEGTYYLDAADTSGLGYLESRGIPLDVATYYGITYCVPLRRIVIPITKQSIMYGWQARSIDLVESEFRMRNNPGFQRARCVMFYDNIKDNSHVIIAEGPFDAMKFHLCGGNVSTMGKVISNEQIDLILAKKPKVIYLALDDDAALEMRALQDRITVPLYRLEVPESAKRRCRNHGIKADFGECTFEECLQAFKDAKPFDKTSIALYLKE